MSALMAHFVSPRLAGLWGLLPLHLKATEVRDVKRPAQADFNKAMNRHRADIHKLIDRYAAGRISEDQLFDGVDEVLFGGHSEAWSLGRRRSTGKGPAGISEADRLMGIAAKDEEQEWLQQFFDDVIGGRYRRDDGTLKVGQMKHRADLYVGKMRGTANAAFASTSPDDTEFVWVLVPEKHCQDCPRIAARSPFTKDTLFTHPGQGDTECLGNCKCYLKRADGVESFRRMDAGEEGQSAPEPDIVDEETGEVTPPNILDGNPDGLKPLEDMTIDDYIEHGRRKWAMIMADRPNPEHLPLLEADFAKATKRAEDTEAAYRAAHAAIVQSLGGLSPDDFAKYRAAENEAHAARLALREATRALEDDVRHAAEVSLKKIAFAEDDPGNPFDHVAIQPGLKHSEQMAGWIADSRGGRVRDFWRVLPKRFRAVIEAKPITMHPTGGRASMAKSGAMKFSASDHQSTWLHEYLHHVEAWNPTEERLSVQYLFSRINPKKIQRLQKLLPSHGYRKDELAEPDQFTSAYFGKIYNLHTLDSVRDSRKLTAGSAGWYGTEIMSMAIEYFESGAYELYTRDRLTFFMMLGRLMDRR